MRSVLCSRYTACKKTACRMYWPRSSGDASMKNAKGTSESKLRLNLELSHP